jgi:hypothetical protein
MKLTTPIDVYILRVMRDGEAYNPTRVQYLIEENHDWSGDDYERTYIAQEMAALREVELLERVPPENSGLSRITKLGRAALMLYEDEGQEEFTFAGLMGKVGGESDGDVEE